MATQVARAGSGGCRDGRSAAVPPWVAAYDRSASSLAAHVAAWVPVEGREEEEEGGRDGGSAAGRGSGAVGEAAAVRLPAERDPPLPLGGPVCLRSGSGEGVKAERDERDERGRAMERPGRPAAAAAAAAAAARSAGVRRRFRSGRIPRVGGGARACLPLPTRVRRLGCRPMVGGEF